MTTAGFVLHLQQATQYDRFDEVTSFVGEDASGAFGIHARHERMMTTLVFGLAQFRIREEAWQYLALPGAVVYFLDNELYLSTRRIFRSDDYQYVATLLDEELRAEERGLRDIKDSLRRMEDELLRRLWTIGRDGEPLR